MIIESGVATGSRLAVFDDRLKEQQVQQSAANYISTKQLNGRTGTFTLKNTFAGGQGSGARLVRTSVTNIDPINLMVIDEAYIQFASSQVALPDTRVSISILNASGGTTLLPIKNDNRFSSISPLVVARDLGGASIPIIGVPFVYPILGDIIDLIPPNSDGIIIPGLPINTINTISNNSFAIALFNQTGATYSFTMNMFIRFMMVPPSALG